METPDQLSKMKKKYCSQCGKEISFDYIIFKGKFFCNECFECKT